jgi:UDP-N-acetylmuramate--alanine ligase
VSFGFDEHCAILAHDVRHNQTHVSFQLTSLGGMDTAFELQVPGRHNVLNALAAVAIARQLDVSLDTCREALREFTGVHRRFEVKTEVNGVLIVDDYAHHPTEIENTLKSARLGWPERRLVALFQPHLYTRTRDFAGDFGRVLGLADLVLLADIYPARERPIPGISSELIANAARQQGATNVHQLGGENLAEQTRSFLKSGDLIVVMGAGTITQVAEELSRSS